MVVSKKFPLLPEKFTPSFVYNHPLRKFDKYQIPIVHPSEFRVPCAKTPPGQSSHQESDKKILADQLKALGHWKHWVYMTDRNGNQPNIIKLDNVTLEELGDRPRADGNFNEATRKMEAMLEKLRTGEMQAREQSCCVVDKNGIPLLYLFSHGTDRGKKKCHGLSGKVLDDFQAEFQHFASRYPPTLPKSDKRHQEIPWMEYLKELMDEADEFLDGVESELEGEEGQKEQRRQRKEATWYKQRLGDFTESESHDEADDSSGEDDNNEFNDSHCPLHPFTNEEYQSGNVRAEPKGVYHLVHAWHPQGHHLDSNLLSSTDSWGGSSGSSTKRGAVDTFMICLKKVHTLLSEMFRAAEPDQYVEYNSILNALKSALPNSNSGAWLGFALLWKAQVHLHRDKFDGIYQWCATVNAGQYESAVGLEDLSPMLLPDLGIAIAYRPGDMLLFRSGSLYHAIAAWKAKNRMPGSPVTPGRVALVCFTPHFTRLVYEQRRDGINKAGKMQPGTGLNTGFSNTSVIDDKAKPVGIDKKRKRARRS